MSSPGLAAPGSPPPEAGQVHSLLARPEHDRALGPYRLLRQLGRGGFAPVWLAEEAHDGKRLRDVAIKLFFLPETIVSASPEARVWRDGVLEEARALCRVEHPNVVRFYALQRDDPGGVIGLVMEHVAGESLDVRLEKEGRLDEATVIEIGIGVAWALAAVHDAGLVHRDVKPGNVIQGSSGYKLIDFGIVVDAPRQEPRNAAQPIASALIGTRGYMAPECVVLGAPSTPSSDLFGLGATLFKLARGFLPPAGAPPTERPASARAPNELADLITLLLEPDPDRRPRHADWIARELERLRAQPSLRPVSSRGFQAPRFEETPAERAIPRAPSEDVPTRTDAYRDDRSAPPELCQHPPLIGRDDVLAALARAAREASAGGVRVVCSRVRSVWVAPGCSKPPSSGRPRRFTGCCGPAAPPSGRARSGLSCAPSRRSRTPARARSTWSANALERALQPGALAGPDEASQALEAIEDALVWASNEAPILLAVDDIQWGDARTLSLLRLLIERTDAGSTGKLLVVATARNEPNPSPALRALLRQVRSRIHAGVRHIALEPLTAEQAAGVARAVSPIAPEVERAVVRGSGHVPFCEARMALAGVSPEEIGLPIAGEAVALAPQCGIALEFAARVLRAELSYASNRRDLAQVEADLTRALAIATAMSSTWQQLHIEGDLAVIEAELGRVGAAIDRLRRLSERAESLGMRAELRLVLQNLGAFLLREGRAAEAAETAKRTADLATEAGDPALRATSLSLRAEALRRAGDLEAALDCVNEASLLQQAGGTLRAR